MLTDTNLKFLQEKIHELRSALFFSMNNSVLKMPTSIISALRVDEVGQVWFFVNRPQQHLQEFDREFPAKLDFLKKGIDYRLTITGKACIVNDPEELNGLVSISDDIKEKATDQLVLMKVKIQNVEYFENKPQGNYNWIQGFGAKVYKMFFNTQQHYGSYGTVH